MSFNFISYLTEARMFYDANDMKGKSADEIAGTVYLMIMALQILRYEVPNVAKSYAGDSMRYQPYEKMHYSATDLGNLIAVLNNQDDFSDKIKANKNISIPLFAINRYLSDTRSGSISPNDDASFFYRLEDYLKLYSNSVFRKLRRDIGDWRNLNFPDRVQIVTLLRREFDKRASSTDLYLWFKQNYRVKESVLPGGNYLYEEPGPTSEAITGPIRDNDISYKSTMFSDNLPVIDTVHGLQLKRIQQGDDLYYGLFDSETTLAGLLQLEKYDAYWQVRLAQIAENYKSQGFGTYLYDYAVMNDGLSILSDTNLSEGGPGGSKGLWEKLHRHGRYTVCGYNLDTNTILPEITPAEVFNQHEDLVCLATPKPVKESISEMLSRINTKNKHRIVEWYGPTVRISGEF